MNEAILKKLEAKLLDRRSFLRDSSLGAAALLGVAAASPLIAFAQTQAKPQPPEDRKKDDAAGTGKKDDASKGDVRDAKEPQKEQNAPDDDGDLTTTKIDADGREYRTCPQCGHHMYQQGRTWTCENCGYSYIE
jgi:ribosomal protein S27AE